MKRRFVLGVRAVLTDILEVLSVVLMALALLGLVAFGLWLHFAAPCDNFLFRLMTVGDLPGRCLNP